MNFYPHHIKDFNHSTRHLTRVERSVYRDATEHYYVTEQPLTLDKNRLAKKLLCRTDEELEALNSILDEFFDETEDGFYHERCDEELEKYKSNISAKAKAGKASAAARKKRAEKRRAKKPTKPEQIKTSDEQPLSNRSTPVNNHKPITNNHEPIIKKENKFNFKKSLIDLGVETNVVSDWLKVRSKKKATNSETAFKSIQREILLSGLPANDAVKIAVENSWSGLKAEWIQNVKPSGGNFDDTNYGGMSGGLE